MSTENLYKALIKAQAKLKNTEKTKDGYNYKYADLAKIIDEVKPILSECRLGFTHRLEVRDGKNMLVTEIIHETGEKITSESLLIIEDKKGLSANQRLGMSVTYMRRYHLSSLLGIASDEDTDDNEYIITETYARLINLINACEVDGSEIQKWLDKAKKNELWQILESQAQAIIVSLQKRLNEAKKNKQQEPQQSDVKEE